MAKPTLADFVDFFTRATKGGAKELDLGDIKSPSLRRGRPSKTPPVSTPINPNEIDLGDIDPLAIKKGRPAKSPVIDPNEIDLGKSKGKLEIGDAPSSSVPVNELDMGDISPISPNIDDYRLPIKSAGIDVVGGGKVPSVIGQAADEIPGPLATRSTTIPTEVGPEVLGKGTSRFTGKADDIIDAEIINKMPDGPLKTAAIKRYAPWLLVGAAGTGALLSQLGKEEAPSAEFTSAKINGAPSEENQPTTTSKQNAAPSNAGAEESQASKLSKVLDEEMAKLPKDEKPAQSDRLAYMEMMQNAQQSANQNQFNAALLKAAMQAGAAIAGPGVKMDTSIADALTKSAQTPVSNVEGLMETEASSRKLKELERTEKEEADLKDPNSEISRFYREKFGPFIPGITKDTSAFAMQKALPQLTQLINVREAAETRKQLKKESDLKDEQQKIESNKFKAQASVDKQISQLYKSKDYEAYNAAKDAQVALDAAIASGDKTEAGTAFMQFGKIAQGDNSVLRDGDMVMLAGGYNYTSVSDMLGKLRAKAAGGNFNDTELKQMRKISQKVQQLKGERVQQLFSPIIQRAQANNLDLLESVDPAQIEEFSGKSIPDNKLTTTSSTRVFKKSYDPGSTVTTTSGSYLIGADGKTGTKLNE
jgi:hypothetical protein